MNPDGLIEREEREVRKNTKAFLDARKMRGSGRV